MKYCKNYQDVIQTHKMSTCHWKNGTYRLAQCRAATEPQFIKSAIAAKYNEVEQNKMRSACNNDSSYILYQAQC